MDAATSSDVITALGSLKVVVALTLIIAVAILAGLWLVFRHIDKRAAAQEAEKQAKREAEHATHIEAAKSQRAKAMRDAWGGLAAEVKGMREDLGVQAQHLERHLRDDESQRGKLNNGINKIIESSSDLHRAVKDLRVTVQDVALKQVGGINRQDSITLIEHVIRDVLQRDVVDIFAYSLRKNNYDTNAGFIMRRVKTEIGKSIRRIGDGLREYNRLSVSPATYLPYTVENGAVRFHLCDDVWAAVVDLYKDHDTNVDEKVARMGLVVTNVFTDALTAGRAVAEDIYDDKDHDPSGIFRAPSDHSGYRRTRSETTIPQQSAPAPPPQAQPTPA